MAKKIKIPLGSNLQRGTYKMHLKRLFPFLNNQYREIKKDELNSLETLHELFGENETDLHKLTVIYEYQLP